MFFEAALFYTCRMKRDIRTAELKDIDALYRLAEDMSRHLEEGYFEECLIRAAGGERDFYVTVDNENKILGYVMLVWQPRYQPFRRMAIPEIQDLSVAPSARRQGVGSQMVDFCEDVVRQKDIDMIGLAVGLHGSFSAAQQLYLKRGYLPDGNGAVYDCLPMGFCEQKPLDDNFVWKMIRELPAKPEDPLK